MTELPDSIVLLESLRLLDVSKTPIKQFPRSMKGLYLLQTLRLRDCYKLCELPKELGCLTDLRHLEFNVFGHFGSMPTSVGDLINLQTLPAFIVGKDDRCGIGELKNINEIRGSLCITGLENVSSAEEAKEAALGDKQHIERLELRWRWHGNENINSQNSVLECLQPHFDLKELTITLYGGSKLPSWMSNPSFTNLASMVLFSCMNCHMLPSVGALPSLKFLSIVGMTNVRAINTTLSRSYGFNAFPKLEKLELEEMFNLEEWIGVRDGDFPCIRHISIAHCPKISILPSLSNVCTLEHLEIHDCMQLTSLPGLPCRLQSLMISKSPELIEWWSKAGWQENACDHVWIDFENITMV